MMPDPGRQIGFAQPGIAAVLRENWLSVPLNQREYSWTEREVKALFQDIYKAINDESPDYFLGSIVTIPRANDVLEVVDGQQRLATTAILLVAIRDYLKTKGETLIGESVEGILSAVDRKARERKSRLSLNVKDNLFYQSRVLGGDAAHKATAPSHHLLEEALQMAKAQVSKILGGHDPTNHADVLNKWVDYLEQHAIVVLLKVPSEVNAYRMFETLNDRGLRTSQSDLVKNYLFGQAGNRINEAQQKWSGMRAVLESFEDDDITINFLRQMLVSLYGHIRETDVYDTVVNKAKGSSQSISFLGLLESGASDYAAILNPQHEKWNAYPPSIRRSIEVASIVRVRAMRPLMLAVARKFTPAEADKAMRLIVSISVRLMIAGGAKSAARSGSVEEALSDTARRVSDQEIETAAKVTAALDDITAKDPAFEEAFATTSVSKAEIARYYLRSLENTAKGLTDPYYVPNDDQQVVNLEHVLPRKPENNWPEFTPEEVEAYYRRLGNMVLLLAKANSDLKSAPFVEKVKIYATSPYEITQQVAQASAWNPVAIANRQRVLAKLAVKTWPITA
jgi:hypothetical protein